MFGVALEMKLSDFKQVIKFPKSYILGLTSQLVLLPLLTIILILILKPQPAIAFGMLLIATCPGGNVSNYAVHLANGNTGLSVLLTATSTLFCSFSTPLLFNYTSPVIDTVGMGSFKIDAWAMVQSIITLLLVPTLMGMALNKFFNDFTSKIIKPVKVLSFVIFIAFVVFAVMGNLENIKQYLHIVFFTVIIHNFLALATGYYFPKFFNANEEDCRCISIETGIQNSGLALVLIFNFFNGNGGMALIAAWWSIWHLVSSFTMAMIWSRKTKRHLNLH